MGTEMASRFDPELARHLKREGYDVTPVTPSKKDVQHKAGLKDRYGKSAPKHYELQLEKQGGKCAICGKQPDERLDQDHDHSSGQLRGLLCRQCNLFIGLADDNVIRLAKAVAYLLDWNPMLKKAFTNLVREA